jgi:hypothetical protein
MTRSRVDLMQLVEEAVEGSWIGYQARMSALQESEIGSVYAPPKKAAGGGMHVETVVDIAQRVGVSISLKFCGHERTSPDSQRKLTRKTRDGPCAVKKAVSGGYS